MTTEIATISGGRVYTDGEANIKIGSVIGRVLHDLSSVEARIGALGGPAWAFWGAYLHDRWNH